MADDLQLKERVRSPERDLEAIHMACGRVDKFTARPASLTAGREKAKEERDTLDACIR